MKKYIIAASVLSAVLLATGCEKRKDAVSADIYRVTDTGSAEKLGRVTATNINGGARFSISVVGLTPGEHGMHIHEKGDCGPTGADGKVGRALAAGGHWDPAHSAHHAGPSGGGHRGDMPRLIADSRGAASAEFELANVDAANLRGRAIIIHDGGDNYSDMPAPLGGGGGRFGCGVWE